MVGLYSHRTAWAIRKESKNFEAAGWNIIIDNIPTTCSKELISQTHIHTETTGHNKCLL